MKFVISHGCAPCKTRALTVCVLFSAEVVRRGRRQKAMVVLPGWHACRRGASPFRFFTNFHHTPTHEILLETCASLLPASLPGESQCLLPSSATRHIERPSDRVIEWCWKSKNEAACFWNSEPSCLDLARMAHYQWMYTSARPQGTRWEQCLWSLRATWASSTRHPARMGDADLTTLFYFFKMSPWLSLHRWQEYPLAFTVVISTFPGLGWKVYERKFWNRVNFWVQLRLAGTGQRGNYTKEGSGAVEQPGKVGQKWQKAQIVLHQDWYRLPSTGCKYVSAVSHKPELCAKDLGHEKVIISAE